MTDKNFFTCCEFDELQNAEILKGERGVVLPDQKDNQDPSDNPETLGLHFDPWGKLMASHFVGHVWIETKDYDIRPFQLQIKPKRSDGWQQVDYLNMAARCLEHPRVAAHMERFFYIWPEKEPLQSDIAGDFRLLVVAQYCRKLAELCKRHLRKEFVRVSDNLTGRVKGRILVEENIRQNLVRGRPDRTVCRYQVQSLDSPLNQILRAALEQCLKELRRYRGNSGGMNKIREWARQCQSTLAGVKLRRINPSEFSSIHLGGLKKAYKKPLNLAKTVLSMLGSDPSGEIRTITPPFALDMNELFERYCEVQLKSELDDSEKLWVGYHNNNLGDQFKVRPDFIDKENNRIIDAKYKYYWGEDEFKPNDPRRGDVFQMLAYSRHLRVQEKFNDAQFKLVITYPQCSESATSNLQLSGDLGELAIQTKSVSLPVKMIKS